MHDSLPLTDHVRTVWRIPLAPGGNSSFKSGPHTHRLGLRDLSAAACLPQENRKENVQEKLTNRNKTSNAARYAHEWPHSKSVVRELFFFFFSIPFFLAPSSFCGSFNFFPVVPSRGASTIGEARLLRDPWVRRELPVCHFSVAGSDLLPVPARKNNLGSIVARAARRPNVVPLALALAVPPFPFLCTLYCRNIPF